MRLGDLVRPTNIPYHTQIGIVIGYGFLRTSVKVLLTDGKIAWYNIGSLEVLSAGA